MECDHCFVWGKPEARGTFSLTQIKNILTEAKELGTVEHVSIEGGEPFLHYPLIVKTVKEAVALGFRVEVLTNCYWATCEENAMEWILPLAEAKNVELTVSSDLYHGENWVTEEVKNALKIAKALGIKTGILSIKYPDATTQPPSEIENVKVGLYDLMLRGRAFSKLVEKASKKPWREFTKCPYENFVEQERVHIDPFGYTHVCQGISIGNAWRKPFSKIIKEYNPYTNPILKPLIHGGPAALVEKFSLPLEGDYGDACHLCYASRLMLRERYPEILAPDQMYGV